MNGLPRGQKGRTSVAWGHTAEPCTKARCAATSQHRRRPQLRAYRPKGAPNEKTPPRCNGLPVLGNHQKTPYRKFVLPRAFLRTVFLGMGKTPLSARILADSTVADTPVGPGLVLSQ